MVIYTKYMLTAGVQWVQTDSVMEPDGIYFRPMSDRDSAIELALCHGEDGILGRPAVALMGYDPEGDRWEVLVVSASPHGLLRRVRMMFGLALEWDGDAPLEFDRGQGIVIEEYTTRTGERAIRFSGLMVGMLAAWHHDQPAWLRAHMLADRLGVTIRKEA